MLLDLGVAAWVSSLANLYSATTLLLSPPQCPSLVCQRCVEAAECPVSERQVVPDVVRVAIDSLRESLALCHQQPACEKQVCGPTLLWVGICIGALGTALVVALVQVLHRLIRSSPKALTVESCEPTCQDEETVDTVTGGHASVARRLKDGR